ncbi:hypothetical protein BDK51DRAFT_36886 [Blyttiomyces helicus]|uniref:Uncharacterized protein n=1 Tax=Blyttiomyces helicus TaxID=388810 RepID=A0A4V1IS00_9FUNG|nr:hypothetical protein BDK51DRAFT_36886 [Blyttiomyces helicus]|eukprot:RKO91827.1 hypothetical protein BDK51DRAFT_36886 [Blyttiomyces helicus]
MKDFGRPSFCVGLQIERLSDGIFLHRNIFDMPEVHSIGNLIVVRTLDIELYRFCPHENGQEVLGSETLYLAAIGAVCTEDLGAFDHCLLVEISPKPDIDVFERIRRLGAAYTIDGSPGLLILGSQPNRARHHGLNRFCGFGGVGMGKPATAPAAPVAAKKGTLERRKQAKPKSASLKASSSQASSSGVTS